MKKNEVSKPSPKTGKIAKGILGTDVSDILKMQVPKTKPNVIKSANVVNPFNSMSDAKTNIKNCSQRIQTLHKALVVQTKNEGISKDLIAVILDVVNGHISTKGKAELIDYATRLKFKSDGIDTSPEFKANQVLRVQVQKVQERQFKNEDKPLKRAEMFKLLGVGKKMSEVPYAVQIDKPRQKSVDAIEREKIRLGNKQEEERQAIYESHVKWFMSLTIDEFNQLNKKRQASLVKPTK